MSPRVVLVNAHGSDPTEGGTEKHLRRLARLLPERGFEVAILAAFPENAAPAATTLTLHRRGWRQDPARRIRNHAGDLISRPGGRVARALDRLAPDLVHTHNLPGIGTGVWEDCRRLGVPVIHTLHDYALLCPRVTLLRPDGEPCRPHPALCGLRTRAMARWAPAVAHVLAVSDHVLARHRGLFPAASEHVIRNPYEPVAGVEALTPPGGVISAIGYMGTLDATKGVDRLVAAAPALAALGVRVLVAGDGRLRRGVEQAARAPGGIEYWGVVRGPDRVRFLGACAAGIMPSVWEEPGGPPNAMLEWLSAGRPVLASARGGLAEATGVLPGTIEVEPTSDAIVAAVAALRDPARWRAAVAAVRPTGGAADEARWTDEHARVYRVAVAGR